MVRLPGDRFKGTSIYSQIDILAVNDFNKLATLCIEKCLLLEVPLNLSPPVFLSPLS